LFIKKKKIKGSQGGRGSSKDGDGGDLNILRKADSSGGETYEDLGEKSNSS